MMDKRYKGIFLLIIILVIAISDSHSQCPCEGGAPVSGAFTPIGGTSNIGVLKQGTLRAISFFTYSNGNEFYNGDSPTEDELVRRFSTSYLGLLIGFGLFEKFTIDAEIGYYLNKMQDFGDYNLSGSGFSHTTIYGKYNVFNSLSDELEWTVGLGGRIPLNFEEQNLPQYIQSSSGAFGGVLLSYLHKGLKSENMHLILVNRAEFNAQNDSTYIYGSSFINSLFITRNIIRNFVGMIELRSDIRLKDSKNGIDNYNSGWNIIVVSPQINYRIGNFNFSIFYDFPVYKYYNGIQLTNSKNLGASLTWQANF
jgi:hypothetical protein